MSRQAVAVADQIPDQATRFAFASIVTQASSPDDMPEPYRTWLVTGKYTPPSA